MECPPQAPRFNGKECNILISRNFSRNVLFDGHLMEARPQSAVAPDRKSGEGRARRWTMQRIPATRAASSSPVRRSPSRRCRSYPSPSTRSAVGVSSRIKPTESGCLFCRSGIFSLACFRNPGCRRRAPDMLSCQCLPQPRLRGGFRALPRGAPSPDACGPRAGVPLSGGRDGGGRLTMPPVPIEYRGRLATAGTRKTLDRGQEFDESAHRHRYRRHLHRRHRDR